MTEDKIALRGLMEKSGDADFLREMIGFAAERLMELEVGALTGAAHGRRAPSGWCSATAIATATGRPGPGRWSCAFPSCARAPTSPASWSRGGWRKRR